MGLDPLSVIAPARLRAILIPAGPIRRSKFMSFVDRLQQEHVVRLGDVSPDGRPHRTMFSPLAFPTGSVIYDLSTSLPPPSHIALAPYELYREPLMVIGIADYASIEAQLHHEIGLSVKGGVTNPAWADPRNLVDVLSPVLGELQVEFPRALVHELLIFDHNDSSIKLPVGMIAVPSLESSKTTTMKTVMCDLTSHLLAEMTTYAKSLQALPMVESPKQGLSSAPLNGHTSGLAAQMGFLAETSPQRFLEGQHGRTLSRTTIPSHMATESRSGAFKIENRSATSSDGTRTPPTTFDEIAVGSINTSATYSSTPDIKRPRSQDNVSMHGFGAGSFGERERNKGKGRVGIIIGSLYLLAGRWPDAVRELTENAMIAKTHNDHIWHAKALDYLIVCLLMCAWAGIDFRIPQVLFPGTEKVSSKSPSHTPSNSPSEVVSSGSLGVSNLSLSLQHLTDVLPELVQHMLNLYVRAWTFTEDKLPQLSFSDSTIRFAKLLTYINLSRGILDESALQRIVSNPKNYFPSAAPANSRPFLTKADLAGLLFRAFPSLSSADTVSTDDRIMILSGMASVLSDLGFHRKKAFILREMLSVLLPALIQARKYGAAEMGLHPAASVLSTHASSIVGSVHDGQALNQGNKNGIRGFLAFVCHAYDIPLCELSSTCSNPSNSNSSGPGETRFELDRPETIIARVLQQASMRTCGDYHLKLEILSLCTSICEALPDLEGLLCYTAEILRIAGSGIAPGPETNGASPYLAIEEQVRLANNISRTLIAGRQLGVQKIEAEYWDEFLVRGIEVVTSSPLASPIPHPMADLGAAKSIAMKEEKNPFIYNPFRKSAASIPKERLIVAEEETTFQVTLQNLYDFDIEIENIQLDAMGLLFESASLSTVVGPYRTQSVIICGTAKGSGALTMTGCKAKVRGCRERSFPMFSRPWKAKPGVKIGRSEMIDSDRATFPVTEINDSTTIAKHQDLSPSSVTLNVIKAQPSLVVKSVSLPQSAIMLLGGETKAFNVILQNISSIPANLLFLSFNDSTTSQLRSALAAKDLSPAEVYELEHTSLNKQTFRWKRTAGGVDAKVDPGTETSLEIEVLGKPALSHGEIHVDYGYLEDVESETADPFYTRQLTIPLTITVNASVELVRNDLLPFHTDFAWQNKQNQEALSASSENLPQIRRQVSLPQPSYKSHNHFQSLLSRIGLNPHDSDHCLLYLDLRNSWPNLLSISIDIRSPGPLSDPWKRAYTVHEPLQPGHTSRILLLLPRIYLPNPTAPIPSLSSVAKRQYIVSSGPKPNPETERASREAFHYREALLNHIRATWEEESTQRTGIIDLRALNLTTRMVSALKLDDLEITISILPGASSSSPKPTHQLSPSRFQIPTHTYLTLTTTLTNRSQTPIHPLLRIQPSLKDQPHNIALDLGKKFLWSGLLQRGLDPLAPGQSSVSELGVIVLCSGVFEIGATVEEIRVPRAPAQNENERSRGNHDDAAAAGAVAVVNDHMISEGEGKGEGLKERRVWYARERLVLIAKKQV